MYRLINAFMIILLLACAGAAMAGFETMRNPGGSLDDGCPPSDVIQFSPGTPNLPAELDCIADANHCYRRDKNDHVVQLQMNGTGLISIAYTANTGTIHIMKDDCCSGEEVATGQQGLYCIELGQGPYYVLFEIETLRSFSVRFEECPDPCDLAVEMLNDGNDGEFSVGDELAWVNTTDASDAHTDYYGGPFEGNWGCQDASVNPGSNWYGFGYYSWFHQDFDWKHYNGFNSEAQGQYCLGGEFELDSAFVVICAYDVDFCQLALDESDMCEHDRITVNGEVLEPAYLQGILGGSADKSKSVTWFGVPLDLLEENGADVNVALDIDAYSDYCTWATRVEWSKLVVYGTCRQVPNPELFDLGDLGVNSEYDCSYETNSLADGGGPANALDYDIAWLGEARPDGSKDVDPEISPKTNDLETTDNGVDFIRNNQNGWWPCEQVCVNVTVTTGTGYEEQPLYLWAWKDGNMDCDFDDFLCTARSDDTIVQYPDECIIHGQQVLPGVTNICFTDPGTREFGIYNGYFRFRLMSMGPDLLDCTTAQYATDEMLGETEDYIIDDLQLAVELLGFNAESENGKVRLLWNTASESANDHFELKRQMVGGDWENLNARIDGAGTTPTGSSYGYIDANVTVGSTYKYQLISVDETGIRFVTAETEATVIAGSAAVESYKLYTNFPNPFNPSTMIGYDLMEATDVQLTVFDVLGRQVATLVNAYQNAGRYSISFEAGAMPSGVYFYRLETPEFSDMKKMMLLK